ncbi:MAG: hypothetical protein B9S32_17630 [Verrucomicrobia bacterium Tous-C9LFEB]|nr:MAG: hypothetical protein B9S32_17630 [Verrucomicrobia bacterium Tous-C9LFEB]
MKANPSLLLALVTTPFLVFSLGAQDNSVPAEAVSRLEASKTFGVTPASSNPAPASGPSAVVTGKKEADISRVLDINPLQNPLFDAPPPEVLQPQTPTEPARPVRRIDANVKNKDADWLLKGMEQQQKLMEEREKAENDPSNKEFTDDPLKPKKPTETAGKKKDDKNDRTTSATFSSPFNSGLGVYSRYTLSGMDAMKQPTAPIDPLSIDSMSHNASLKPSFVPEDPLTAASDAAKIRSPIIDPLASVKLERAPSQTSRLSVDDWLANVKERERAALLPQQAPNVQDFYDKNQVRAKAPEPKITPPPVVDTRPKASTMKNSIPPNRAIKDPNEF